RLPARSYDGNRHVALPALRGTTIRGGALLGVPPIVDHLFDLSPLPTRSRRRRGLVCAGPETPAPDRPRAARPLGGTARRGRRASARCEPAGPSSSAGHPD